MILGEDKFVTARKSHICTLCDKEIAKGESYRKYVWLDEGEFHQCKEHEHCNHLATEYELYDDLGHIDMDYYIKLYDEESKEARDE